MKYFDSGDSDSSASDLCEIDNSKLQRAKLHSQNEVTRQTAEKFKAKEKTAVVPIKGTQFCNNCSKLAEDIVIFTTSLQKVDEYIEQMNFKINNIEMLIRDRFDELKDDFCRPDKSLSKIQKSVTVSFKHKHLYMLFVCF